LRLILPNLNPSYLKNSFLSSLVCTQTLIFHNLYYQIYGPIARYTLVLLGVWPRVSTGVTLELGLGYTLGLYQATDPSIKFFIYLFLYFLHAFCLLYVKRIFQYHNCLTLSHLSIILCIHKTKTKQEMETWRTVLSYNRIKRSRTEEIRAT